MDVKTACNILNNLVDFGPVMSVTADDFTHRFEGGVCVTTHFKTVSTSRDEFLAGGYDEPIVARAGFCVIVTDCKDEVDLLRCVLEQAVISTLVHEIRETTRFKATGWAPFHPHKTDGMNRWGTPQLDMAYGLVKV